MVDVKRIDSLRAGGPYTTREITLELGQNLKEGALLGKVTATGEYKLSVAGAGDGSEVPDLVLVEDCDATDTAKLTLGYEIGQFNVDEMTIDSSHTIDSIREGLRLKGILLANVDFA